jgi:hypothetical protein
MIERETAGEEAMKSLFAWTALAVGIAVIVAVAIAMLLLWNSFGPSQISPVGWLAMGLGIVATLALAAGLISAMLISYRRGYDERVGPDR